MNTVASTPSREHGIGLSSANLMNLGGSLELSHESIRSIHTDIIMNEVLPELSLHEPTALLLDINNLFRRAKYNGFMIDYSLLKDIFQKRCNLRYAAAFSAVDRSDPAANKWSQWMKHSGYEFFGKDLVRYTDEATGRNVTKGNMDIEIALEAVKLSPAFTHVILGTCDGDFVPLVRRLQEDPSRKVSVLGISGHNWSGMSRSLAGAADNFYDLSRIQEHIAYRGQQDD